MTRASHFKPFRNVLVPVVYGCDPAPALAVARAIAEEDHISLVGVVRMPSDRSLSEGTLLARQVRAQLGALISGTEMRRRPPVRVSYAPWDELKQLIRALRSNLLVLEWSGTFEALGVKAAEVVAQPPCDIAMVRGSIPQGPMHVLMSVRGGPQANLALRLALAFSQESEPNIAALHTRPVSMTIEESRRARPFRALDRVLRDLPEVKRLEVEADDPAATLVEVASDYDLVIVGATGQPSIGEASLGRVGDQLLAGTFKTVIAVKAKQPMPTGSDRTLGQEAISVLVDKWFAANTYHADEFADLSWLLDSKRRRGLTISLVLPALNEEATVGNVIRSIKSALMENVPLIDEIVLMDSRSTDRTAEIAQSLGVPVFIHQDVLPQYGLRRGKGEALWKSLHITRGDLVFWIDTDIINIHPRFVYGLIGPLLLNPGVQFVKGFYRRPLRVDGKLEAGGGGRVTELTARPLLNLFYPELSGVIQPLSGEYGGRRSLLEQLPFYTGYGVETGMLIDVLERAGLSSIAQVDLEERIHRNQPLQALSKMSFAIIQVVINKIERRFGPDLLEDVNTSMKLIRQENDHFYLEVQEIIEYERPPMATIPEYIAERGAG
jgi:glycosyltransferase involved in cell wall biosynthesis/nucleotide-binding universal stress UspA family protein